MISSGIFLLDLKTKDKCFSEDGFRKLIILGFLITDTLYKNYGNIWQLDEEKRKEITRKVFSSDYRKFVNALGNYKEVEKMFNR